MYKNDIYNIKGHKYNCATIGCTQSTVVSAYIWAPKVRQQFKQIASCPLFLFAASLETFKHSHIYKFLL